MSSKEEEDFRIRVLTAQADGDKTEAPTTGADPAKEDLAVLTSAELRSNLSALFRLRRKSLSTKTKVEENSRSEILMRSRYQTLISR